MVDLASIGMSGDGDWSINVVNGWTSSSGANLRPRRHAERQFLCSTNAIPGCTIPDACNYNSSATSDDGSCDLGTPAYFDIDEDGFGQFFAMNFAAMRFQRAQSR